MAAKVIVVAASKGGPGKTTLVAALGAYVANLGFHVELVDADPQQSLGLWWERRGWPSNPNCTDALHDRDLGRTISATKEKADYVIVDLPGSLMRTDVGIKLADLVVIPVRPSLLDLEAVNPVRELADEAGVPCAFVINSADKNWSMLSSVRDALTGDVLVTTIRYHEGHPAAMVEGLTAAEIKGPSSRVAKAEITALWAAIISRLAPAKRPSKSRA